MNVVEAWDTPEVVSYLLRKLSIRADLLGYDYLCTAIEMVVNDISCLHNMTKVLYPEIAKVHNTTPQRVERAIRHSIVAMLKDGRAAYTAYEVTGLPHDGVTNSMFIGSLAHLIVREPHNPIFEVRNYK